MAINTVINKAAGNVGCLFSKTWLERDDAFLPPRGGGVRWMYVCSMCWTFKFVSQYNFFGTPVNYLLFQYWNGSYWNDADGSIYFKNSSRIISINNDDPQANYRYYQPTCKWRVKMWNTSGNYPEDANGSIWIYAYGGWGTSQYDQLLKEKRHIKGSTVNADKCFLLKQTYDGPPSGLSIFNTVSLRNSLILDSFPKSRIVCEF